MPEDPALSSAVRLSNARMTDLCQAIPRKVLQICDDQAEVMYDGEPRWVHLQGMTGLEPGDYVVVYAEQVLEQMPPDEAEDILRFYEELEQMLGDAHNG
jgi:hydrogenase assembly chaperone HypC/HupF